MGNSSLVDPSEVEGNDSVADLVKDLNAATKPPAPESPELRLATSAVERPTYVEDKYWDGNIESSLQKQHEGLRSLQTQHGRMANELGAQRKLADELIGLKRTHDLSLGPDTAPAPAKAPRPKVSAADLLKNPEQTLEDYWTAKEATLSEKYESKIAHLEEALSGITMKSELGDDMKLADDPDWHTWLDADPERKHLASYAANGDNVVAKRLIREYKEGKAPGTGTSPAPITAAQGDRVNEATAAALEVAASAETSTRGKVYSRKALMLLRAQNPEVYEDFDFQQEIIKAYNENRVK